MGKRTMSKWQELIYHRLAEPEDEMCEPPWSEPLELTGVEQEGQGSSSSSTPASEIDPATLVPPTSAGQMSRFFALNDGFMDSREKICNPCLMK